MTAPEPRDSATHPTTPTPTRSAVLGAAEGQETATGLDSSPFAHLSQTCWCGSCDQTAVEALREGDIRRILRRMNLCPHCGNKRCPRSWDHQYACSGSNEPGQVPVVASDEAAR
ncbi:MAG: hypothetical protein ACXV5Q_00790 [Frankiaceae bacterium]